MRSFALNLIPKIDTLPADMETVLLGFSIWKLESCHSLYLDHLHLLEQWTKCL
jgi:hypothetical protein